jgi:hypothetical protein
MEGTRMNKRLNELAVQAGGIWRGGYVEQANGNSVYTERENVDTVDLDLHKFAMLVIQDYENDVRESRREVMSELGFSRIGRNNV